MPFWTRCDWSRGVPRLRILSSLGFRRDHDRTSVLSFSENPILRQAQGRLTRKRRETWGTGFFISRQFLWAGVVARDNSLARKHLCVGRARLARGVQCPGWCVLRSARESSQQIWDARRRSWLAPSAATVRRRVAAPRYPGRRAPPYGRR